MSMFGSMRCPGVSGSLAPGCSEKLDVSYTAERTESLHRLRRQGQIQRPIRHCIYFGEADPRIGKGIVS